VPEILVQLRQMLYDCNGLQQEGIFRHSGTESELIPIRDRLNRGEIVTLTNPHNIATLLKVPRHSTERERARERERAHSRANQCKMLTQSLLGECSDSTKKCPSAYSTG